MPGEKDLFRAVYNYGLDNGYGFGFPNFHQENHDGELYYGTVFIKSDAITGPVHAKAVDLGNPDGFSKRFEAVHNYAEKKGYGFGFPNFHQKNHDGELYYGTVFIKSDAITGPVHVKAVDLGNPDSHSKRFRAVHDYAEKEGYGYGFPNYNQKNHDGELYYGTVFIKSDAITGPVHAKAVDLFPQQNPSPDPQVGDCNTVAKIENIPIYLPFLMTANVTVVSCDDGGKIIIESFVASIRIAKETIELKDGNTVTHSKKTAGLKRKATYTIRGNALFVSVKVKETVFNNTLAEIKDLKIASW